jgi:hypothetical protein
VRYQLHRGQRRNNLHDPAHQPAKRRLRPTSPHLPKKWHRLNPATGRVLLEELGRYHANDPRPEDRPSHAGGSGEILATGQAVASARSRKGRLPDRHLLRMSLTPPPENPSSARPLDKHMGCDGHRNHNRRLPDRRRRCIDRCVSSHPIVNDEVDQIKSKTCFTQQHQHGDRQRS